MTLTLDITPELEKRIQDAAEREGVAPEEWGKRIIEEKLGGDAGAQDSDQANPDFFAALDALTGLVEGYPDWSSELDYYLYGKPKRSEIQG